MAIAQQQFRRVCNLPEPLAAHLIDTQLGSAAEAVLYRAQHTVYMMLVTLELNYHIHYVLQNLRACNGAVLCYVTDEDYRDIVLLCELQKHCSALAHLRHAAG